MSNYSNFDLRKFLAEGNKADEKSTKGRVYQEGVEENLNEEPVSIAAVAAGVAAVFGGSIGLTKLMDKLEAGDFGPKGEKLAKHLRDMGKGAADAIHHRGFEEGIEGEEEINELSADAIEAITGVIGAGGVVGASIVITKLMDKLKAGDFGDKGKAIAKYLEDHGKAAADAIHRHESVQIESKNSKLTKEAAFKKEIKSILES